MLVRCSSVVNGKVVLNRLIRGELSLQYEVGRIFSLVRNVLKFAFISKSGSGMFAAVMAVK